MHPSVFVFRVLNAPGTRAIGWAALCVDPPGCAVDGPFRPEPAAPDPALWRRVGRELAGPLPTRPLPVTSAVRQAVARACGHGIDHLQVQYVAWLPGVETPSPVVLGRLLADISARG